MTLPVPDVLSEQFFTVIHRAEIVKTVVVPFVHSRYEVTWIT